MKNGFKTLGSNGLKMALIGVACAGLLTGCLSDSNETAGGGNGTSNDGGFIAKVTTSGKGPIEVKPDTFAAPIYCPPIQLQSNTYLIMKFERGREDDPAGLLYQATIEEWARSCATDGNAQTRIKLGLSGNVTPGPAWKGGEVVLPLRVAIIPSGGEETISSEILNVPVTVGEGAPSEAWTLIEDKFVVTRNQEMKVVFGFDEGKRSRR